jgi:hypothetical protein
MRQRSRRALVAALLTLALLGHVSGALGYPLDGYETSGIARLEAQRMVQEGQAKGRKRPPGELLPLSQVDLRLLDHRDLTLPPSDPQLTGVIQRLIGPDADRYGIALLDLSDVENPRYAEWNGHVRQNPGSIGKLLVALAIFQALADIYPDDIPARRRILRETIVTADAFSVYDHHAVAFADPKTGSTRRRPLAEGDQATLWTYLDWMMSPSSNSAAGMLQKNLILMAHYGKDYPPSPEEDARFFRETPKAELSAIFEKALQTPLARNGLDPEELRQGGFFTRQGKRLVPAGGSYATPRALVEFMLKLEQGRLVDEFSSREIKRLMYVTERRIRYASSGALRDSAVYFKSGSLYSCQEEEGFTCKKYHGNKRNYMNSVALVESPAGQDRLHYMVSVLSNVLRKNSAVDHRDLARAVHGYLLSAHPAKPVSKGELPPSATFGEGFIGYEAERRELRLAFDIQEALIDLGYAIGEIDGIVGSGTRRAIRSFQTSRSLEATGKPSQGLLETMRRVAADKGLARPETGNQ